MWHVADEPVPYMLVLMEVPAHPGFHQKYAAEMTGAALEQRRTQRLRITKRPHTSAQTMHNRKAGF